MKPLCLLLTLCSFTSVAYAQEDEGSETRSCELPSPDLLNPFIKKSILDISKEIDFSSDYSRKVLKCYRPNERISATFDFNDKNLFNGSQLFINAEEYPASFWQNIETEEDQLQRIKNYFLEKERRLIIIKNDSDIVRIHKDYTGAETFMKEVDKVENSFSSRKNELLNESETLVGKLNLNKTVHYTEIKTFLEKNAAFKNELIDPLSQIINSLPIQSKEAKQALLDVYVDGISFENEIYSHVWRSKYEKDALKSLATKINPSTISAEKRVDLKRAEKSSFNEFTDSLKNGTNYGEVLLKLDGWSRKSPLVSKKIGKLATKLKKMNFETTDELYSSGEVAGANTGIINYISNSLIPSNPKLIESTWKLLDEVNKQESSNPFIHSSPNKDSPDLFSMALKITDGDPIAALDTITLFGHDDCCNYLTPGNTLSKDLSNAELLLNAKKGSVDSSFMYSSGAVKGLDIDPKMRNQFKEIFEKMDRLSKTEPTKDYLQFDENSFRSAYYHFYGGMFTATQLIKEGLNKVGPFGISDYIAEKLAGTYKRLSFEGYMSDEKDKDSLELYHLGYKPGKKIKKPIGWEQDRFEMATLKLELNFLHIKLSEDQHRKGAEFAAKKIQEWVKGKSCSKLDLNK